MQALEIGQAIQQGEVYIKRVAKLPMIEGGESKKIDHDLGYILAHSENGNHHILTGGEVLELPERYEGLQQFAVTLNQAQKIIQDAANPHKTQTLPKGFYEIRISRERDPFLDQARRVMD